MRPRWLVDELLAQRDAVIFGCYVGSMPTAIGEACAVERVVRVGREKATISLTDAAGHVVAEAFERLGYGDVPHRHDWYSALAGWNDLDGTELDVLRILDEAIRIAKDDDAVGGAA